MRSPLAEYFWWSGCFLFLVVLVGTSAWVILQWQEVWSFLWQTPGQMTNEEIMTPTPAPTQNELVGKIWRADESGGLKLVKEFGLEEQLLTDDERGQNYQQVGLGLLLNSEQLLTAGHVVGDGAKYFWQNEKFGWQEISNWQMIPDKDLAVGTFKDFLGPKVLKSPEWNQDDLVVGEKVVMWVNGGLGLKRIEGEISSIDKKIKLQEAWGEAKITDLSVIELTISNTLGDSGSPVFLQNGQIIGVMVGVDTDNEMKSFAVPITELF